MHMQGRGVDNFQEVGGLDLTFKKWGGGGGARLLARTMATPTHATTPSV